MGVIGMSKPLELAFLNLVLFAAASAKGHTNPYSIVYPTLLAERSVDGTKVVALNEGITLNLAPTDVFSDNFVLSTARKEDILHTEFDTTEIRRTLYHDEALMAAVSMSDDGGVIEVRGVIGETLRIEPVPLLERRANGRMPHRLFRARNVSPNDKVTVSARADATANAARPSRVHLQHVVVEIFILCDTAFLKFFLTDAEMTDYLAITVAAVNLRYKSLQRPTIKFTIVGILKLSDVVENTFMETNGTYLDAQPTLLKFMRFTYGGGLREADVTYLVTGMDMSQFYQGKVYSQLAGLAYVATLCSYDGVAIGEDRGAVYSGVDIMAHELAHSLGCVHDGDGPYQKPAGHKGSTRPECGSNLGYIMSPRRSSDSLYRFKFSPCCQEQMRLLLSTVSDSCLEETFNVTQVIPNIDFLPGNWLTPHEYCMKKRPHLRAANETTMTADKNCKVTCRYFANTSGLKQFSYKYDALDGMPCGDGRRCENGVCS